MFEKNKKSPLKELLFIFPVFLAITAFLKFILFHKSAFNYPASDMFPFFSRMYDPSFALNDFFTNACTVPNARFIFGYLILFLSSFFGGDWYAAVFLIKTLLVILIPVGYYLSVFLLSKRYLPVRLLELCQLILTFFILLIMMDRFNSLFSIAWWPPYYIESTSSVFALLMGLTAIVLSELKLKGTWYLSLFFFLLSTLFHPAIGIFCIGFYLFAILYFIQSEYKRMIAILLFGIILPSILLSVLFSPAAPLSTRAFIDIYILNNHPFHYHFKDFGSSYPLYNWPLSFSFIVVLMVVPLLLATYTRNKALIIVSVIFIAAYILCVGLQYVFIDALPLKMVAVLGPVRFSQFGYWMMVLLWIIALPACFERHKLIVFVNFVFAFLSRIVKISSKLKVGLLILIVAALTSLGVAFRDDPFSAIYLKNKALYDFLKTTPKESVFVIYKSDHTINFPVVGKRAVFTGNGFPFNESDMAEFDKRSSMVYGNYQSLSKEPYRWQDEKIAAFFRKLKPVDFIHISKTYLLDYVVIEKNYSGNFRNNQPVFEDTELKIYKVRDLK